MSTHRCRWTGSWALRAVLALAIGTLFTNCDSVQISQLKNALVFEEALDFGPVSLSRSRLLLLEIENQGRSRVLIEKPELDPEQGSDFFIFSHEQVELLPGEKTRIEVRFAPSALGEQEATLKVPTSANDFALLEVALSGKGVLGKAEPGRRRVDFGKVGVMATATEELPFVNDDSNPAEVVLHALTGPDAEDFHLSELGDFKVKSNSQRNLELGFTPPAIGEFSAVLPVRLCPSCDLEEIELVGEGIAAVLVVEPREVDFGHVDPHSTERQVVTLRNLGSRPVHVSSATLSADSSSAFELGTFPAGGVTLEEGEEVEFEVRFTPPSLDAQDGSLRISTDHEHSPVIVVPLRGSGGGPRISVVPNPLLFPRTALGMEVEKTLSIRNFGHDPGGLRPLIINEVVVSEGREFRVRDLRGEEPPYVLAVGDARTFVVTFKPEGPGLASGELRIASNDTQEPEVLVPLRGTGVELGPCEYSVTPGELDFASVSHGSHGRLAFGIRNVGSTPCALANPRTSPDTSPAFSVQSFNSVIFEPGEMFLIAVEFAPESEESHRGEVLVDISSVDDPLVSVPLRARAISACLEIEPEHLDFGEVGLACQPPTLPVSVRNSCNVPVEIDNSWLGSGATDNFELVGSGPITLPPGSEHKIDVLYHPRDEQSDSAPLYLQSSLSTTPRLVSLEGTGVLRPTRTDTFEVPLVQKVDVLIVMDNSGSMTDLQDFIGRNFDRFLSSALSRGIDFHIAVTTTGLWPYQGGWARCPGGVEGGEAGRFFPVDNSAPRILTPSTPNLREVFKHNIHVGICHWWEEGLEASRLALSPPLIDNVESPNHPEPNDGNAGFLREDAKLVVLYISDEEDDSTRTTQAYIDFLRSLKPGRPEQVSASAIVGYPSCGMAPSAGLRYMEVVSALGGLVEDICNPDWGGVLQRIGEDAFTPIDVYPLSTRPDGRALVVLVEGSEVPDVGTDGKRNWRYDPIYGENGGVRFEEGRNPGPGQRVEIRYPIPCE